MCKPLRVAVIGAGMMGRHHVRVYSEMDNVQLVGIADMSSSVLSPLAHRFHCPVFTDYRELLDKQKPDAVSIAVPTVQHLEVISEVARRSIHILVEKPIASSIDHGQAIIEVCETNNVMLAVGHIERFNPSVIAVKEKIASGELGRVFQIDARRQGPYPARIRDVGVVVDLAVHDIDVMCYITGSEAVRVYAEVDRRVCPDHEDSLSALVKFDKGEVGMLTTNWLTPTKIRELLITGERGMFRVDYLTQDLCFFENASVPESGWDTLSVLRGVSEGRMIRYAFNKKEPLRAELETFIQAVEGKEPHIVSGKDGLKALSIALALLVSSSEHKLIHMSSESVLQ